MKRAFQITIAFGCIAAPAIGQPADPTLVGQWGSVTTLKLRSAARSGSRLARSAAGFLDLMRLDFGRGAS